MTKTIEEFRKDFSLLFEGGLVAIKQGDEETAKKLFNACEVLDPQGTSHKMGYGLIAMHKMETNEAKKIFEEVIRLEPENWRAQSFLAFTLMLSLMNGEGTIDAKRQALQRAATIASEVVEKSPEETDRQLAQSVLDWEQELQNQGTKQRGPAG